MHLQTPTTSFHLQIVGYEFPGLQPHHNNHYDPDWLSIRVTATTPEGTWTVTDPSLLTSEITELIDWLSALSVFRGVTSIRFEEPNISLRLAHIPYNQPTLEVHLAAEDKAPWHRATPNDTILAFPLPTLDLPAITQSLKSQLARFPPRNPL